MIQQRVDLPLEPSPDPSPYVAVGQSSEWTQRTDEERARWAAMLADDMAIRWRRGERPPVEEYLDRYPQLRDHPEIALELVYEEICLQQEFGCSVPTTQLIRRFPQWRAQLEVLVDCHQRFEPNGVDPTFPVPGESIANFKLLSELGRGAQGRVFLATQPQLADRPVVVKFVPGGGREHLSMARLQHTHIVPLYSVHDFADRGVKGLCMPYFGGTTLARILESLKACPLQQRNGQRFLDELDKAQSVNPENAPGAGPARQFFAHADWLQAVCWIGASLADALDYAHQRGLVHLDVKPSNVLIASDGQPMLLDFHLARSPIHRGEQAPESVGGTAEYMSIELQQALASVRRGTMIERDVDGRSDVYSLGVLLYEALGGCAPTDATNSAIRLDARNEQVSTGLADLVAKCLAPQPGDRYPTAGALSADLRRHLADLPLRGVTNRSLAERWNKWRRRRPHALAMLGMAITLTTSAILLGVVVAMTLTHRIDQARAALVEGTEHLRRHQYEESIDAFNRGISQCDLAPGQSRLRTELRGKLSLAEHAIAIAELHKAADQLRVLYAADLPSPDALRPIESRCCAVWESCAPLRQSVQSNQAITIEPQVQADLLDLAILWADLHVRLAPVSELDSAQARALDVLDEAERAFGPSAVLYIERQRFADSLGLVAMAKTAAQMAAELPPRSSWEHYALGRSLLANGRVSDASAMFERAVEMNPEGTWPNLYLGTCAFRLGRFDDAITAFTVCTATAPDKAGCFYNRALAYAATGRIDRALTDLTRALDLEPELGIARLNRAMLRYRLKQYDEALMDLQVAFDSGADRASVCYTRALVYLALGDQGQALDQSQRALELDRSRADARTLYDQLSSKLLQF